MSGGYHERRNYDVDYRYYPGREGNERDGYSREYKDYDYYSDRISKKEVMRREYSEGMEREREREREREYERERGRAAEREREREREQHNMHHTHHLSQKHYSDRMGPRGKSPSRRRKDQYSKTPHDMYQHQNLPPEGSAHHILHGEQEYDPLYAFRPIKFSELRIHFYLDGISLASRSIKSTKDLILMEFRKYGYEPVRELVFLDLNQDGSFTAHIGFRYDYEAYAVYKKTKYLRIPLQRKNGDMGFQELHPSFCFEYLALKRGDKLEVEIGVEGRTKRKTLVPPPYDQKWGERVGEVKGGNNRRIYKGRRYSMERKQEPRVPITATRLDPRGEPSFGSSYRYPMGNRVIDRGIARRERTLDRSLRPSTPTGGTLHPRPLRSHTRSRSRFKSKSPTYRPPHRPPYQYSPNNSPGLSSTYEWGKGKDWREGRVSASRKHTPPHAFPEPRPLRDHAISNPGGKEKHINLINLHTINHIDTIHTIDEVRVTPHKKRNSHSRDNPVIQDLSRSKSDLQDEGVIIGNKTSTDVDMVAKLETAYANGSVDDNEEEDGQIKNVPESMEDMLPVIKPQELLPLESRPSPMSGRKREKQQKMEVTESSSKNMLNEIVQGVEIKDKMKDQMGDKDQMKDSINNMNIEDISKELNHNVETEFAGEKETNGCTGGYLMGTMEDMSANDLFNELQEQNLSGLVKVQHVFKTDETFHICNYFHIWFRERETLEKIYKNGIKISGQTILIIPIIESYLGGISNFLHLLTTPQKDVDQLLLFHQVKLLVPLQYQSTLNLHSNDEVDLLHANLEKFGEVIDLRLECPEYIIVTYRRHQNVLNLMNQKRLKFDSFDGQVIELEAKRVKMPALVRNIKHPGRQPHENYMPVIREYFKDMPIWQDPYEPNQPKSSDRSNSNPNWGPD